MDHLKHAQWILETTQNLLPFIAVTKLEITVHIAVAICKRLDAIIEILLQQFGPCSAAEQVQHEAYLDAHYHNQEATC